MSGYLQRNEPAACGDAVEPGLDLQIGGIAPHCRGAEMHFGGSEMHFGRGDQGVRMNQGPKRDAKPSKWDSLHGSAPRSFHHFDWRLNNRGN